MTNAIAIHRQPTIVISAAIFFLSTSVSGTLSTALNLVEDKSHGDSRSFVFWGALYVGCPAKVSERKVLPSCLWFNLIDYT